MLLGGQGRWQSSAIRSGNFQARTRLSAASTDRRLTALLPFAGFLLAVFCFHRHSPRGSLRAAILSSCVAIGAFSVLASEILSVWKALDRAALLSLWTAALAGLVWLSLRSRRLSGRPTTRPRAAFGAGDWLMIAVIVAILLVVVLIALVAAPNNFDSMTYHLSRIAHWQQNQSVGSYPTNIPRQLYLAPGAEYLVAQLFILSGSDQSANVIQWWALLGCVLGVSLIASRLGAGRRGQLLSSALCVTLPMAVLQGSSTQNDLVAALWAVCALYFGWLTIVEVKPRTTVLLSLSLGLLVVTKASAALLLIPFFLIFVARLLRRRRGANGWRTLAFLVATVPLLAAPHLFRTHRLWGNPLGPMHEAGNTYLSGSWTAAAAISGLSRNLALHAGTSWGSLDSRAEDAVRALHGALGIDADDPRTTWGGLSFGVHDAVRDEDAAGNPLHLLLFMIVIACFAKRTLRDPESVIFAICLVAAFVLFSSAIRWMPWHTRLHLPLFVLATALTGATLSRGLGALGTVVLCLLLAFTVGSPLLNHQRRPLLGASSVLRVERSRQYFAALPKARTAYLEALEVVERELGCDRVGLALGSDDFEYPLWALSNPLEGSRTRFEHVAVLNASARLSVDTSPPCAVLVSSTRPERRLTVGGSEYRLARDLGSLRILLPATEAEASSQGPRL